MPCAWDTSQPVLPQALLQPKSPPSSASLWQRCSGGSGGRGGRSGDGHTSRPGPRFDLADKGEALADEASHHLNWNPSLKVGIGRRHKVGDIVPCRCRRGSNACNRVGHNSRASGAVLECSLQGRVGSRARCAKPVVACYPRQLSRSIHPLPAAGAAGAVQGLCFITGMPWHRAMPAH